MVKEIIKDTNILTQKSERFDFNVDNVNVIQDLIDTANANIDRCAGLAAVQIGVLKKVIVVKRGEKFVPMINPTIVKKSVQTYLMEESCLSLEGATKVRRHREIRVTYSDSNGKSKCENFKGYLAEIIQHECDHLNGILI